MLAWYYYYSVVWILKRFRFFWSRSGDGRVNQHPDMAVSQVALLRLHNFLATEFAQLNPQWNDEILYQEARKFVIAIIQHITYNEFLPILLGNLTNLQNTNVTIWTAFRLLHGQNHISQNWITTYYYDNAFTFNCIFSYYNLHNIV